MPDMATEETVATTIASSASLEAKSMPNMPKRKATLMIALMPEPSMFIVAPMGSTMSVTSLEMPVSSETSMLVGIVATDEQVPKATAAGRKRWRNMVPTAPLPPPKRA